MSFRLRIVNEHPLTTRVNEYCAAIYFNGSPITYGWGYSKNEAYKNCIYKFRVCRTSSRKAREKELMETQKFEYCPKPTPTTLPAEVKAQLDAEIAKIRETIQTTDRVLLASKALELESDSLKKLEESRREANLIILQMK